MTCSWAAKVNSPTLTVELLVSIAFIIIAWRLLCRKYFNRTFCATD